MTILTAYKAIQSLISTSYPPEVYPELHPLLMQRYSFQPEPTERMQAVSTQLLTSVSRLMDLNPSLPEPEVETTALQEFQRELQVTLQAEVKELLPVKP